MMKNPETREKLTNQLKLLGYMDIFPVLKVEIKSSTDRETELTIYEEDLVEVFKRF